MTDVSASPGIPMPAPLYRELERRMLDALASGEWKPGDAIPAERRLAERYSVSIGTVRKAIDALVDANLLIRQQGRGTYVATHTRDRLLYYFFHVVPEGGGKEYPDVRMVAFARGKADRVEAEKLAIALADPVIRVRNLLHLGGERIDRLADGADRHAVALGQSPFGRDGVAGLPVAALERVAHLALELAVERGGQRDRLDVAHGAESLVRAAK